MSDGQTEACEANAPEIDWSQPLEIWNDTMWLPAQVLWQSDKWALIDFDGTPAVYWKPASKARFRNAPAPPLYRLFTYDELPDLVGRRFRHVVSNRTALAICADDDSLTIDGYDYGKLLLFNEFLIDDHGQWVPAGVRQRKQ